MGYPERTIYRAGNVFFLCSFLKPVVIVLSNSILGHHVLTQEPHLQAFSVEIQQLKNVFPFSSLTILLMGWRKR